MSLLHVAVKRNGENVTPGRWYVKPNDLVGGWCVMPGDYTPAERQEGQAHEIADFTRYEDAQFAVFMHNKFEPILAAVAERDGYRECAMRQGEQIDELRDELERIAKTIPRRWTKEVEQ